MTSLAMSVAASPATAQGLCSLLPCVLFISAPHACSMVHWRQCVQLHCIPLDIWAEVAAARAAATSSAAHWQAACLLFGELYNTRCVTLCCFAAGAMHC